MLHQSFMSCSLFLCSGDGFVSLEEYVKVMSTNFVSIDIEKERMKAAFSLLDRDNDGRITRSEFRAVMMYNNNEMTEKKVDELFDEVDSKRKGYLDYEGMCTQNC